MKRRKYPQQRSFMEIVEKMSEPVYFTETIHYAPVRQSFLCAKCNQKSATRTHVVVDEQRECLLEICSCCGHEATLPVGDSKNNYDLPSVDEAKKAKK